MCFFASYASFYLKVCFVWYKYGLLYCLSVTICMEYFPFFLLSAYVCLYISDESPVNSVCLGIAYFLIHFSHFMSFDWGAYPFTSVAIIKREELPIPTLFIVFCLSYSYFVLFSSLSAFFARCWFFRIDMLWFLIFLLCIFYRYFPPVVTIGLTQNIL